MFDEQLDGHDADMAALSRLQAERDELRHALAQQAAVIEQMREAFKLVRFDSLNMTLADWEIVKAAATLQPCPEVLNKVRAEAVRKFFDYFVDGRLANIHISEADNYIRRIEKGEA